MLFKWIPKKEQLLLTNGDESNRGLKDFSAFSRWRLSDDWRVRETAVTTCISLSEIPEVLPSVQRILKARVLIKTTEPPCVQNVLKSKNTLDIVMKTPVDKTVEGFISEYSANVGEALAKEIKSGMKRAGLKRARTVKGTLGVIAKCMGTSDMAHKVRGDEAFALGHYREAIPHYKKWMADEAMVKLGEAYMEQGMYKEAEECLRRALGLWVFLQSKHSRSVSSSSTSKFNIQRGRQQLIYYYSRNLETERPEECIYCDVTATEE